MNPVKNQIYYKVCNKVYDQVRGQVYNDKVWEKVGIDVHKHVEQVRYKVSAKP
jgi:hypothetical protein